MPQTKLRYYSERLAYLDGLLASNLSAKQRRAAEAERMATSVKLIMARKRPYEKGSTSTQGDRE